MADVQTQQLTPGYSAADYDETAGMMAIAFGLFEMARELKRVAAPLKDHQLTKAAYDKLLELGWLVYPE
jgi:hypothetical protein